MPDDDILMFVMGCLRGSPLQLLSWPSFSKEGIM